MEAELKPKLNLKAERIKKQETQADTAKIINVSEQTYNQKEIGKRDFSLTECELLAKHYGTTIESLFFTEKVNKNKTICS